MKDLGITKGECVIVKKPHQLTHIRTKGSDQQIATIFAGRMTMNGKVMPIEETIANGKVMTDALNTAQKCGLLPSELLEIVKSCEETMNILLIELPKTDIILRNEVSNRLKQIKKATS